MFPIPVTINPMISADNCCRVAQFVDQCVAQLGLGHVPPPVAKPKII